MSTPDFRSIEEIAHSPVSGRTVRLVLSIARDGDVAHVADEIRDLGGTVLDEDLPFDTLLARVPEPAVGDVQALDQVAGVSCDHEYRLAQSTGN